MTGDTNSPIVFFMHLYGMLMKTVDWNEKGVLLQGGLDSTDRLHVL